MICAPVLMLPTTMKVPIACLKCLLHALIDVALLCRFDRFSLRLLELTKNADNGSRLLLEGVSVAW